MIDVTKKSVILIQQGRRQTFTMLHCFIINSDTKFFFAFENSGSICFKKLDGPLAKYAPTNSPIDVMLKKAKNTKIDMEQVAASNSTFKVS